MFTSDLFAGKTVLVTGGGSGIGLEITRQFLVHGAEAYIASRKAERLEQAMRQLQGLGTVHSHQLDIREPERIEGLVEIIAEKSGKLDILINNAGGQFPSLAEEISPNGWQAVVNTNLNGTWYATQSMANRFFLPQQQGTVINIVLNNFRGCPGMAHSGAARAGVSNLTKSLAVEWAQKGIRLNCIAPGITKSSGLEQYPPELLTGITDSIPMQRLGTTEEVAALTLFLASPLAAYITGETIYIDGGARLWGDIWQYPT
ncbi:MAG: SDR family oxidoreductase [Bacteroidetes bacterium]|nr:MAG: SDR family oxidoreductase [Bacteroidota bacterium]